MSVMITRKLWALALLLIPLDLAAQTNIGSRTADVNSIIDFSGAATVRPMPVGTVLPGTCTVGDHFFKSNATAGQNINACTSANTWTQEGGSGGSGSGQVCPAVRTNATTITIASGASSTTPCVLGYGNVTFRFTAAITCIISANGGTLRMYMDIGGVVYCGYGGGTFAGGNVTSSGGTTAFPITAYANDVLRLGAWTATAGTWDVAGSVKDEAEASAAAACAQGSGISVSFDGKTCTISSLGSAYFYFKGPQAAVTQTGSNVDVFPAITGVSALAAGGCYLIEAGLINDGGAGVTIAFSVSVDSTSVYTAYSGTGIADNIQLKVLYCNQNGVQNAQTAVSYPTYYGNSPNAPASTLSTTYTATPTAVDWTTTHTIHIYTNIASGTITPKFVHIVTQ